MPAFQYGIFKDLEKTFQTENEALAFGYLASRARVNDLNSNRSAKTK